MKADHTLRAPGYSPYTVEWTYGPLPAIGGVPGDCSVVVWSDEFIGTLVPMGVAVGYICWGSTDALWSRQFCLGAHWCDGVGSWETRNVWWCWLRAGTDGLAHTHPTWEEMKKMVKA